MQITPDLEIWVGAIHELPLPKFRDRFILQISNAKN
jgi:hypothetical protein